MVNLPLAAPYRSYQVVLVFSRMNAVGNRLLSEGQMAAKESR